MNDEGRLAAAPDITAGCVAQEPTVPRHLVVTAWEVLGDGNTALALELLTSALEQDIEPDILPRCDVCGVRAWAGHRERHIFSAHRAAGEFEWMATAA